MRLHGSATTRDRCVRRLRCYPRWRDRPPEPRARRVRAALLAWYAEATATSHGAARPTPTPCWSARSCSSRPRPRAWPSDSRASCAASPPPPRWRRPRRRRAGRVERPRLQPSRPRAPAAARVGGRDGWPTDVAGLERLPGVGPYTARAVATLAFGIPVGVVDTNVRRWLLRRFGGPDDRRRLQGLADRAGASRTRTPRSRRGRMPAWSSGRRYAVPVPRAATPARSRTAAPRATRRRVWRCRGRPRCVARIGPIAGRSCACRRAGPADGRRRRSRRARTGRERVGPALDDAGWERVVIGLERDGLAHRRRGDLRLGAATIGR